MRPFRELVRHFFFRFLDPEAVSSGGEARLTIVHILALMATPGLLSFYLFPKYVRLAFRPRAATEIALLGDRCLFLAITMVVIGFLTVLQWDTLFPDRRDYAVLTPLPVHPAGIFGAKLAALAGFLLLFFVDINTVPTLAFSLSIAEHSWGLYHMGAVARAHATAMFAATAFVFFFFAALHGLLLNVFSFRLYRKVSGYVQFAAMVLLLAALLMLPYVNMLVARWRRGAAPLMEWTPPLWFLGWYQVLLGESIDPSMLALAHRASVALWTSVAAMLATYALSYWRHARRTLESESAGAAGPGAFARLVARLANRYLLPHPVERAVFHFVAKTTRRSVRHWLFWSGYVGAGLALVVEGLAAFLVRRGWTPPGPLDPAVLPIPLILTFFTLSGMRVIFDKPSELSANWLFRLTVGGQHRQCLAGVRKAMYVFGVAPVFAALLPVYAVFWGAAAIPHLLYCLALSAILAELLLLPLRKIPFTCTYLPGKSRMTLFWFFYYLAFTTYAFSSTALEQWMTGSPARLGLVCAAAALLPRAFSLYWDRVFTACFTWNFEDPPELLLQSLGVSE